MYKVASDRKQSALHHGRLSDWMTGEEYQTEQQKVRQLKEAIGIIEARILKTTGDERKQLGLEKQEIQKQLHELRKKDVIIKQAQSGIGDIFMDCAKQMLSKVQFDLIFKAAVREQLQLIEKAETVIANGVIIE